MERKQRIEAISYLNSLLESIIFVESLSDLKSSKSDSELKSGILGELIEVGESKKSKGRN